MAWLSVSPLCRRVTGRLTACSVMDLGDFVRPPPVPGQQLPR